MSSKTTEAYGGRATITFHKGRGDKHYYLVNVPELDVYDLYQPSVTQIIGMKDKSNQLVSWATRCMSEYLTEELSKMGETVRPSAMRALLARALTDWRSVRDEKADIGSLAHKVLEQEIKARAGVCPHPELPLRLDPILAPGLTAEMLEQVHGAVKSGFEFLDAHDFKPVEVEGVRWSPRYGYLGTGDFFGYMDGKFSVIDWKSGLRLYETVWLQLAAYQKAWEEEHPDQPIAQRVGVNIGRDGVMSYAVRDNESLAADFKCFLALLVTWRWNEPNKDYYPKEAPRVIGAF